MSEPIEELQWARDLLAKHNGGRKVIVGSAGSVYISQDVAVAALSDLQARVAEETAKRESAEAALRQIDAWRLQIRLCVKASEPSWLDGVSEALEVGRHLVNGEQRP